MPGLSWRGRELGVPVKNYIVQSTIFAICAFGLIGQAAELWRTRARLALVLFLLAARSSPISAMSPRHERRSSSCW